MNQPLFIYADYLTEAAVAATDSASGFDPLDVLEAEEDNVWKPANQTGDKALTIDLSAAQEIGCLALVGDMLNGVELEVRASTDNFAASDVQVSAPAAMSDYITHWRSWTPATYRYWRLIFSGMSPSFNVAHAALCPYAPLPYFNDGMDLDNFGSEGTMLIAPDGRFLGSNRQRTMRQVKLDWGQVTDVELVDFQRWADAVVKNLRAFFLVPDLDQLACRFCWCDAKQRFSAPVKHGLASIGAITVNARIP